MRTLSAILVVTFFYQLLNAAQDKAAPAPAELVFKEGEILPGPFYAFVVHGPRKDRLRALINEKPDKTFILMFFQGLAVPEYL
ncbi:MAG: hypothetical protein EBQ87_15705, partial [Planctomycetes bacterium]|nr:hypothetical protein [Planctomycetota bacterium]